jgi:hypothetical protein
MKKPEVENLVALSLQLNFYHVDAFEGAPDCYCPNWGLDYCSNKGLLQALSNVSDCLAACQQNSNCTAWTWSPKLNSYNFNCELYSRVSALGKYS